KANDSPRPFDLLGFTLLSIAIGTFQLMLDRGETVDWFGSREIVVEAIVAGVAACMFIIHMLSDEHPFLPRDLFRDRNLTLGLVFPPLTTLAFATVPARVRTEGAALNALMRNLGASVGVAALVALLDRNIQINRSGLAEHLSVFNPLWRLGYVPIENGLPVDRSRIISHLMPFGGAWPFGSVPTDDPSKLIGMWGEELNRQAATIAYLNDFRVLAIATVIFMPLLFFMRRQAMFARPSRR